MKTIAVFDAKNYNDAWPRYSRAAVRAIIIKNGKIAMVKSAKEGYYKFPGGGVKPRETHKDALIREVREETGLRVRPSSIKEYGMVYEKRKSTVKHGEIFEQRSRYYFADVEDVAGVQDLDDYEAALGFTLEWVELQQAYDADQGRWRVTGSGMLRREATVLRSLLSEIGTGK